MADDDFQGAGSLNHRTVQRAVVRGRGEAAGGQDLLESPRVPARLGSGQHALRLGDQLLRGRRPQKSAQLGGVGFGCLLALLGVMEFGLALVFFGGQFLVFGAPAGGQILAGVGEPVSELRCGG
jgi:hypothetical protein